jgi:anaerobic selenocysteine-containing dehydrogenase
MTRRTSLLEREVSLPFVEVNAKDAADLKIRNGQMVVVEFRRGSISWARITDIQRHAFMPFHFSDPICSPARPRSQIQNTEPKVTAGLGG